MDAETSIWKIITALPGENPVNLNRGTATKILNFAALIQGFEKVTDEGDAWEAAKTIAEKTGILKELYHDKSPEGLSRHENIQELLNGIQEFSINALEEGRPARLENYLEDVALLTDQDTDKDEDRDKVTLMTVHSAKGLEFKNVFVVGLEENLFPSAQSEEKRTPEALEEERRLFYVALTRAKENAWFSYANQRYRWGNLEFCSPSRFLVEMDENFLDGMVGNNRTGTFYRPSSSTGQIMQEGFRTRSVPDSREKLQEQKPWRPDAFRRKPYNQPETGERNEEFTGDDPERILQGMIVEHQRFGQGKVLKIEGVTPNKKATVFFHNAGQKQLLLKFAKLKIKG